MNRPKRRQERQAFLLSDPLPRLVLLPGLHPDADPRPALLPTFPRGVPVLFPSVGAALAELRRLRGGRA